ncbi:MAG: hypothetical protein ABIR25_04045 [Sphingomicrobium sp.]
MQGYRLKFGSELVVDVHPDGRIITSPSPGLSEITIDHFLADQVHPRLIAHAGSLVVHAGGVRVGERALLVMGQSGRGKSTLTASFDLAGMPLLGDDAMVISMVGDQQAVRAVYPSLRLLPDSIDALMRGTATAGPVAYYTSKERIDVAKDGGVAEAPIPISAMFSIAPPNGNEPIVLRRLTPVDACMALVESSFALDPSDTARARDRMEQASALARRVPAFEITYPRDYSRLPEVRQAILDQVAALEPT